MNPQGSPIPIIHGMRKPQNGSLGSSSNWSEYIYENAEVMYMKETGVPKSHWCARIQEGTAVALKETNFLGPRGKRSSCRKEGSKSKCKK
jgi:hypothetical protein